MVVCIKRENKFVKNIKFCTEVSKYIQSLFIELELEAKSLNTIKSYSRTYSDFIKFCRQYDNNLELHNIHKDDLCAFIKYKSQASRKKSDIATSSKNLIISALKKLFDHIEKDAEELYDFNNVFIDLRTTYIKPLRNKLKSEEIKRIEIYLEKKKKKEKYTTYRNILLFKLMLYGGLNVSEVLTIRFNQIVLESEFYRVFLEGHKNKSVCIRCECIEDEVETLRHFFNIDPYQIIAQTSTGRLMDRVQLYKVANTIYIFSGVRATGVRILRQTYLTSLRYSK